MPRTKKPVLSTKAEDMLLQANRVASFKRWRYRSSSCTSAALARAGFFHTKGTSAKCAFCSKEMDWDPNDVPISEHASHCPLCPFVLLGQPDENEITVEQFLRLRESSLIGMAERLISRAKTEHVTEIKQEMRELYDVIKSESTSE